MAAFIWPFTFGLVALNHSAANRETGFSLLPLVGVVSTLAVAIEVVAFHLLFSHRVRLHINWLEADLVPSGSGAVQLGADSIILSQSMSISLRDAKSHAFRIYSIGLHPCRLGSVNSSVTT